MNLLKGAFGSLVAGKHPADGAGAVMDLFHALENVEHFASQPSAFVPAAKRAIITDAHTMVGTENLPLWIETSSREKHNAQKDVFMEVLSKSEKWRFFEDWYLGMWDGTFENWDLAHEVAKIENEVWEQGLDAVAARIGEIEAKHEVIIKIGEIPRDTAFADRHGIGGNSPPESLDEIESVASNAIVKWSGFEALEKETNAENPSADRVKAAIALLTKGLGACLAWLGRKGDLATDETIKALTKWGAPIGGAYLLAHPAKLEALIDAAKTWLGFL